MNKEVSKPRETKKSNQPIMKNYPVSIVQRSKLIGIGGSNLKRIYAKTGVTINPLDETNFSIFAPNQNALQDAEEMIKSYIDQPVLFCSKSYSIFVNDLINFSNRESLSLNSEASTKLR